MTNGQTTIRLELCNEPSATFTLRRAVDQAATECRLTDDARFELKLAATEALTNALKGAPSEHAVEVAIFGSERVVDVEVVDRGRFKALAPQPLQLALRRQAAVRRHTVDHVRQHLRQFGNYLIARQPGPP